MGFMGEFEKRERELRAREYQRFCDINAMLKARE